MFTTGLRRAKSSRMCSPICYSPPLTKFGDHDIYTWKNVREHLLLYKAKFWTLHFPTFLKCINKTFLNNQHLYYLKLLQGENDEYQVVIVTGSGHFGYRSLVSDFRTLSIILAINSSHEVCTLLS